MNLIRQGIEILRSDGPLAFLRGILRFVYWNMGIRTGYLKLRHRISGHATDLRVGDQSVTMETRAYPEFERFYDLKGERETLTELTSDVLEGEVFYDIGANVGLYSCLVGSAEKNCDVYSFEPHPANVEALERNLLRNGVNSEIFRLALADEEGTVELSSEGSEAGLGEHSLDTTVAETTVTVEVKQLDTLRKEYDLPVPTLVKIDVEGAELDVIDGATETFSHPDCSTIYCEVHPKRIESFGGSYEALKNRLTDLGFHLELTGQDVGGRKIVKATK